MSILVFGGLMIDRYYFIDRFPKRGQDGKIKESKDFVGGCAINMAVTIKNLGGEPYIISYLGADENGRACMDYLREMDMSEECVLQADLSMKIDKKASATGYCLVFVEPDGERTFLTKEGIEGRFDEMLLPEKAIDICDVATVTGYYLLGESGIKVADTLQKLKDRGYVILFDPSPMVGYIDTGVLEKVVDISNVLTPNFEEAIYLAEHSAITDPQRWAKSKSLSGTTIILTQGAKGGSIFHEGRRLDYEGFRADTVDSTGAGDSFVGALSYGMSKGWSLNKSVAAAARCAALTAAIEGPHGQFGTEWVTQLIE